MPKDRMRWAELLDVLTDSDRNREIVLERATENERMALFLLRREGWSAQVAAGTHNNYDPELVKPGEKMIVEYLPATNGKPNRSLRSAASDGIRIR